jgi:hypothetical protein
MKYQLHKFRCGYLRAEKGSLDKEQKVDNGLLFTVRSPEMTGDKPKWLDGLSKELG